MAELRIIRGTAKGMKLRDVPGDSTRPITDMVKEALFNIIGDDIINAEIWDLFAGTGSVSIEALSRGAKFAKMSDLDRFAVDTLNKNLEHTRLAQKAKVIRGDVFLMLQNRPDHKFDYIYVAPPQYKELWIKAMRSLDSDGGWLVDDGWIVVQIHPREYQALELTNFEEFDQRKYGNTLLVFYRRPESENETTISPD